MALQFPDPTQPSLLTGDERGVYSDSRSSSKFPLRLWDETVDVVVAGFGGAGASAAVEAAETGASVLVADRFTGGGSTEMSGGVVYAGGGTELQKRAGSDDSPEEMYKYLLMETRDAVGEDTLRAFCDGSVGNLEWLRRLGVPFHPKGKALKTSYPPDDCTLYYSGNELSSSYAASARPAPRGHRALGKGLTGKVLFKPLRLAVEQRGVKILYRTEVHRLVADESGGVIGVELRTIPANPLWRITHQALYAAVTYLGAMSRWSTETFNRYLSRLETWKGRVSYIRARGGVVLSTGGFVFNPDMMRVHSPRYSGCSMRLGTAGDSGSGVLLGRSAGGKTGNMEKACAFRFINPPSVLVSGVIVGADGHRICNEELYGAAISEKMAEKHGGKGYLIVDSEIMRDVRRQLIKEHIGWFQRLFGLVNIFLNRQKAPTIRILAVRSGITENRLVDTIGEYNSGIASGADPGGKAAEYCRPVRKPPFYAINLALDSLLFPTPHFTLGGLVVDGVTARVVRADGTIVPGLYAAGRTAVGVSSNSYVSGLSIADGVFSGRNAGRHSARRALDGEKDKEPDRITPGKVKDLKV